MFTTTDSAAMEGKKGMEYSTIAPTNSQESKNPMEVLRWAEAERRCC